MQSVGYALGITHKTGAARVIADAYQDAFTRGPRSLDGTRLHFREQLLIDPVGGAAQCKLAQRGEVCRRKEMLERALRLSGNVDFPLLEPLDQIVGRQINELDGIGAVEYGIRHCLAHAYMGDL